MAQREAGQRGAGGGRFRGRGGKSAQVQDESGIDDGEGDGEMGWWGWGECLEDGEDQGMSMIGKGASLSWEDPYRFSTIIFPPPAPHYVLASLQHLARFIDGIGQQAQLARDERCVVRVAGPGADVDNVEGLIEEGEQGGELGEREGVLEVERVGGERAGWGESMKAELDVLEGGGLC